MFTQSVVTKNTEDIRDRLRSIGYDLSCPCCEFENSFIFTMKDGVCHTFQEKEMPIVFKEIKEKKTDLINCIGNEDLFLAIAALREDSDINQFYTDGTRWELCVVGKACYEGWENRYKTVAHKATVQELIEHFKEE